MGFLFLLFILILLYCIRIDIPFNLIFQWFVKYHAYFIVSLTQKNCPLVFYDLVTPSAVLVARSPSALKVLATVLPAVVAPISWFLLLEGNTRGRSFCAIESA